MSEFASEEIIEKRKRCKNPICGGSGNCDTCKAKDVIENSGDSYEVVSKYSTADIQGYKKRKGKTEYNLTIDLGTTTLVFQLTERGNQKLIHAVTSLNSQKKYGADVISRIQAATQQKAEELRACIIKDLRAGIAKLTGECDIHVQQLEKIVIAGNTTMIHLLMGYDCSGLGKYPFAPVNLDMISEPVDALLGAEIVENRTVKKEEIPEVIIFPGISAFVGGDILSGLYALDFHKKDEICLLIDLGTNGEIALGNKDRILVASTAAGPAFEGGNISWGTGSVAGAVSSVKINRRNTNGTKEDADAGQIYDVTVRTIHDKVPCGICGTGVIEIMSELLKQGIVNETGLLSDKYFDNGFPIVKTADGKQIVFTQKDIRELQLAKAAIRAGVETLLLRYGITEKEISRVYLAGGFGYFLNMEKAAVIGMLSKKLAKKAEAVGNTSLAGANKFLLDNEGDIALESIKAVSEEIVLAKDSAFSDLYMNAMFFE